MKYIPSIAFEEMSVFAKGVTAAKTRGRKYIRKRRYGGSTRTEFQASVKSVFKQLSQSWKALSNAQIKHFVLFLLAARHCLPATAALARCVGSYLEQARPVSGRPQLDSIQIYQQREYITQEVKVSIKPKRWGIGLQAGYGVSLHNGQIQPSPYIGVGVSWNFLQFYVLLMKIIRP